MAAYHACRCVADKWNRFVCAISTSSSSVENSIDISSQLELHAAEATVRLYNAKFNAYQISNLVYFSLLLLWLLLLLLDALGAFDQLVVRLCMIINDRIETISIVVIVSV